VQDNFDGYDVFIMLVKAILFGFIMTSVSCYKGFTVHGGAVEIGKSSTQAVVLSSIIMIIVNFFVAFFLL
jgi:phospholipid/cholesterol/gamma-HCH transport system permease protein